jgi:hypothetical protein
MYLILIANKNKTTKRMKNGVFWDVMPCGSCKNRRFGGTSSSFIKVTRIGELGTTLAATSNRRTLRRSWFLQEPHGLTSQKTPFFIVTAVKTSNLTQQKRIFDSSNPKQAQFN